MEAYVFVEHSAECPHAAKRFWRKCSCRKWIYIAGDRKRIPAKTRSWEEAERFIERLKAGQTTNTASGQSVSDAVKLFLEDKRQQHISDAAYRKTERLLDELKEFCRVKPIKYISEINLEALEEFRKGWKGVAITRRKKQERLRSFFHYCIRHEWIKSNPSSNLSRIRVEQSPTDYFNREEFAKLLDAIPLLGMESRNPNQSQWRQKIKALILLMRWSGLRIGDAVTLPRERLRGDSVFLYTQKTGVPVYVPIPPEVALSLRDLPNSNTAYFFWSGNGNVKSAVGDYQRSFRRLCKHANLGKRAHPHMLRDTFAVELLLAGVSIEEVAVLLGHSSIRITERHYAPFVKARQEQLERSVKSSWRLSRDIG